MVKVMILSKRPKLTYNEIHWQNPNTKEWIWIMDNDSRLLRKDLVRMEFAYTEYDRPPYEKRDIRIIQWMTRWDEVLPDLHILNDIEKREHPLGWNCPLCGSKLI